MGLVGGPGKNFVVGGIPVKIKNQKKESDHQGLFFL